jgi:integrase
MNSYLKEIGQLAELNEGILITKVKGNEKIEKVYKKWELLSSHVARRSFSSNLFIQGFPPINIMKITGHKTEKAFMRYIRISQEESANTLQAHWDKIYSEPQTPILRID